MNARVAFAIVALALGTTASAGEKTSGVLPGILIGPKLSLIALPTPSLGVEAKGLGMFGASVDLGYLPMTSVGGQGNAKIGFTNISATARVFPFAGSFFLGAGLGSRTFKAEASDTATGLTAKAEVSSVYIAPQLGWRWIWESGFFMGVDLGWQFVVSHKLTLTTPIGANPQDIKDVQDASDTVGKVGLPILGLLQLGWFF
jgi:hypothetical protein